MADAKAGKLDPVVGRDAELRRVVQILSRKTKNNPVLIGDPGVGKTAIVEGLAQRIARGDIPENLRDCFIYAIDMGSIVAGTKYRGDFEARMKAVLNDVKTSEGQVLLFMDELHTVIGAGSAEGSVDAGNMLKPMLARGELHMIGATTVDEYRRYVEKDAAFERRFQPVLVDEPSVEDTISILRGLREGFEVFHGVQLQDAALVMAAQLAHRYITDRRLPDKAIDLIDESCAMLRTEIDSMPAELDGLTRRVERLSLEQMSLARETDASSQIRLVQLEKELKALRPQAEDARARWEVEREALRKVQELRDEIERIRQEVENAERSFDLTYARNLERNELPELERRLEQRETELAAGREKDHLVNEVVTPQAIAAVVSRWTGIPVSQIEEAERDKLLRLESILHEHLIGQEEAVDLVTDAIIRARSGIKDPRRPIGSFIFLGPTGVGKTELAKTLAKALFDSEDNMVRIDMTEYQERHTVSRLVGAPPGYVGFEEGGQLTEAVRRKPFSVVLFDEIEKAHPDVFNTLLQVLDDGRLTDAQGRRVDFRNSIIIMTSNVGSQYLLEGVTSSGEISEEARELVMGELRSRFRPEFLNRVDDIVVFKPLSRSEIEQIVELMLNDLRDRLRERRITVSVAANARRHIAKEGFDPVYGARPLRRYLSHEIESKMGRALLGGDVKDGASLKVTLEGGEIVVTWRNPPTKNEPSRAAGRSPQQPARRRPTTSPTNGSHRLVADAQAIRHVLDPEPKPAPVASP